MLENIIHVFLSIFFYLSVVALTFSIFKKPLIEHQRTIIIISTCMGLTNFYFRFILASSLFPVQTTITFLILLTILKRYPVFYSFIISSTSFVVYVFLETLIFAPLFYFGITSIELLQNSMTHFLLSHLLLISVMVFLTYLARKFDIGFSFIIRRFKGKQVLKSHNFFWCILLLLSITSVQFMLILDHNDKVIHHYFVLIANTIIFLIAIFYAYKENKKALYARYKVFENMKPRNPNHRV